MPATYEPIATTTLGSAQATVTFSSISGVYTDLILILAGNMTADDYIILQVNNDTGSNYSNTSLTGNGSSASSGRQSNLTYISTGLWTTGQNNQILNFQNYSNTTTNKTIISRNNAPANSTATSVNLWRSTAAINTIKIYTYGGQTFASGTTFTLYGIKAA